jgi:hypothetical protein
MRVLRHGFEKVVSNRLSKQEDIVGFKCSCGCIFADTIAPFHNYRISYELIEDEAEITVTVPLTCPECRALCESSFSFSSNIQPLAE